MQTRVLVTGGAGFIGRHVAKALLQRGYRVRVLDALIEQVHGSRAVVPASREVELVEGDIRNPDLVRKSLIGVDSVVHLAAEVGVGQSMYAIERYVGVNDGGTAVLFDALARAPVRRIVVASSMSVYGEGLYAAPGGRLVENAARVAGRGRRWDPVDEDGAPLVPVPTPEWKQPALASIYALTKFVQEQLTLIAAPAYKIEGCALRLFNVFGPGQALSNPYTGVLAIFASRLLNRQRPLVFEDGLQRRDFVHVADVADAFVLALERPEAAGGVFNIGSGRHHAIRDIARRLATAMGRPDVQPEIIGKARVGDIRHCFADIALARKKLGFEPRRRIEDSLHELAEWVQRQRATDRFEDARRELEQRGLVA